MASAADAGNASIEMTSHMLSAGALIDRAYLAEFTMNDPALEQRFLTLFLHQAPLDIAAMREAFGAGLRSAVHGLKSSACGIGAWHVVECAEDILALDESTLQAQRALLLDKLSRRVEDVIRHIRKLGITE